MLKIKDNVDLKELEKFGFKHEESSTYNEYIFTNEDCIIYIDCKDRILSMTEREYDIVFVVPSVIYDLIQAGLVEEVKEKPNLSDAERVILENLPKIYGYITRDANGNLFIYQIPPVKIDKRWFCNLTNVHITSFTMFNDLFQFIKWEDKEPYNIEELLKGEQV